MGLEVVKKRLLQREEARSNKLDTEWTSLLHSLQKQVPDFVATFPSVSRVVIFGSLVREGYFNEWSDVDIAVWGLDNADYWDAMGWFEQALHRDRIDLVRIEDANPRIVKHIARGREIYAAEP